MGAQVSNEELIARSIEAEVERDDFICGGLRISHELVKELGFDTGFGRGSFAEDVASFVVNQIVDRDLIE